jgi:hypothetical protein
LEERLVECLNRALIIERDDPFTFVHALEPSQ